MKLGLIGAGFISHFHAVAIEQVRGLEIGGILKRSGSESLSAFCREKELGSAVIYNSIAEMAGKVDILAIFAPNYTGISIMEEIVAAVKSGGSSVKGVICEKPLGRNVEESRKLVTLAKEANLLTSYFENQLFMRVVQNAREQLFPIQDRMGPPSLARSSEEHAGPHEPWFWDPTRSGGGVLLDMGCHSIAVSQYVLTPKGKDLLFLQPQSVTADLGLLKWGNDPWKKKLLDEKGVDYSKTPAEDFATGMITYRNPETGQLVKGQFTNSWMFEKQGMRLLGDATGPGYSFEINTLVSPLNVFVGDEAAESIADQEKALEKATSSRGLLAVHPNEADLYGYPDIHRDTLHSFRAGKDAMLSWEYGLEIMKLIMASYLSAERKKVIDMTDPEVLTELESYKPAIQRGEGASLLL